MHVEREVSLQYLELDEVLVGFVFVSWGLNMSMGSPRGVQASLAPMCMGAALADTATCLISCSAAFSHLLQRLNIF